MAHDALLILSDSQKITATGSTASTNYYDAGVNGVDPSADGKVDLVVQVVQSFNNLTSLTVEFQASDDPTFTTGVVNQAISDAIPLASLVAPAEILRIRMPFGPGRYRRLNYIVAGTAPAQGALFADLQLGRENVTRYASGLNLAGV